MRGYLVGATVVEICGCALHVDLCVNRSDQISRICVTHFAPWQLLLDQPMRIHHTARHRSRLLPRVDIMDLQDDTMAQDTEAMSDTTSLLDRLLSMDREAVRVEAAMNTQEVRLASGCCRLRDD